MAASRAIISSSSSGCGCDGGAIIGHSHRHVLRHAGHTLVGGKQVVDAWGCHRAIGGGLAVGAAAVGRAIKHHLPLVHVIAVRRPCMARLHSVIWERLAAQQREPLSNLQAAWCDHALHCG